MAKSLDINHKCSIPWSEFDLSFSRSSGPGGQNVNKVNSKATLRWNVVDSPSLNYEIKERFIQRFGGRLTNTGDIIISASESRDQAANISSCLEKLGLMLAQVVTRPKKRRPTKPSRAAKERRIGSKKIHGQTKRLRRSQNQE